MAISPFSIIQKRSTIHVREKIHVQRLQTFKVDKNVSTRDDFEKKVDQKAKLKRVKPKKKKSKKKRRKDNQRKERKATQTLAIVLGENFYRIFY